MFRTLNIGGREMIKALEVSSNYEVLGVPKGANWLSEVYVVQRQCLRVTMGRSSARFSKTQGASEPRPEPGFVPSSPKPESFEIDLEFVVEPLALVEF
jgi:hypothetical protein